MLDKVIQLQTKAVHELEQMFSCNKKEITFKAPTGAGKTFIMARFMDSVLSKNPDTVFIVSSLSKAKLAEQNHNKFKDYLDHGYVKNIKPYLISSEDKGENALYISQNENVYSLPRDLYKKNSKLKDQQAFLRFIIQVKSDNKQIILIKDESHIATKNLDELNDYFYKVINVSATPKTKPDVLITEFEAIEANLIKNIVFKDGDKTYDSFDNESLQFSELRGALTEFIKVKEKYHKFNINPCFIIQISNTELGQKQFDSIMSIFKENDFKDLKYVSMAQDPKLCTTNDQLIKAAPTKWEKYVVRNDSLIDVIIFKMVITEGWDIPRACMLFQIRDSKSKQLDEQVLGRVRRNPLLLDFENIDSQDKPFLTTAYVWGLKDRKNTSSVQVKLKGAEPFDIAQIKNQIQEEIKVMTTRIKDLTAIQNEFNIENFLHTVKEPMACENIFTLYENFQKSTNDIQKTCETYCSNQTNYYHSWFKFNNNLPAIRTKSKTVLSDYNSSMEIVTDNSGTPVQCTLPFDSLYYSNNDYTLALNDWIWNNDDEYKNFTFDSDSERNWINKMTREFNVKTVNIGGQDVKLVGKNFLVNSNIKYQYYSNGIHDSYPDFIMKDDRDRFFLFEVKSLNVSSSLNIDSEEYQGKIATLKNLYSEVSKLLKDYYFCLPILKGKDWNIWVYHKGLEQQMSFDELRNLINS